MLFPIYFFVIFAGLWFWIIGFWTCCALVASSPVGALTCWIWARRNGLDAARCAWLGAFYWASGFMPWFHFGFQLNDRPVPQITMKSIYAVLFLVWLAGPVILGFFWASEDPFDGKRAWLVIHAIFNLLAWIAALFFLMTAKVLPTRRQRIHIGHVVPSMLGALSMLSWLPYALSTWRP